MRITKLKAKIRGILKNHGVKKAAVFGSIVRGKYNKKSDVDFLLKLPEDKSLLDIIGLKLELEKTLGRKVDILEYKAIKPSIRRQILSEERVIYEQGS